MTKKISGREQIALAAQANVAISTVTRVYDGTASERSYLRVVEAARQLELPLPPYVGTWCAEDIPDDDEESSHEVVDG